MNRQLFYTTAATAVTFLMMSAVPNPAFAGSDIALAIVNSQIAQETRDAANRPESDPYFGLPVWVKNANDKQVYDFGWRPSYDKLSGAPTYVRPGQDNDEWANESAAIRSKLQAAYNSIDPTLPWEERQRLAAPVSTQVSKELTELDKKFGVKDDGTWKNYEDLDSQRKARAKKNLNLFQNGAKGLTSKIGAFHPDTLAQIIDDYVFAYGADPSYVGDAFLTKTMVKNAEIFAKISANPDSVAKLKRTAGLYYGPPTGDNLRRTNLFVKDGMIVGSHMPRSPHHNAITLTLPADGQIKTLAGGFTVDSKGVIRNPNGTAVGTLSDKGEFLDPITKKPVTDAQKAEWLALFGKAVSPIIAANGCPTSVGAGAVTSVAQQPAVVKADNNQDLAADLAKVVLAPTPQEAAPSKAEPVATTEPKKYESVAAPEPQKFEAVAVPEPKKYETVAAPAPKQSEPVAAPKPKKSEPVAAPVITNRLPHDGNIVITDGPANGMPVER